MTNQRQGDRRPADQGQDDQAGSGETATSQIISPSQELKEKCLRPGNASLAALEAISNAEAALEKLSVHFRDWMVAEAERLSVAQARLREDGVSQETVEALFEAAHDLKGQGATLGYPLAADICASLCRLLEAFADQSRLPMVLVDHHIDAVKAMVRENATGTSNFTANELSERLRAVTDDVIACEGDPPNPAAA